MIRIFIVAVALAAFVTGGCQGRDPAAGPVKIKVMTFNVLCSFCGGNEYDPWSDRLDAFRDFFVRYEPDLIGLQELTLPSEVDELLAMRPGFGAVYFRGVTPGPLTLTDYPDATILYRKAQFELIESGSYWLSPTPDTPWSAGFATGGQLPRMVAWARLMVRATGRDLVFITTHFDNNSPSQERSSPLLLERTTPWADRPLIITGDFNSKPGSVAYRTLAEGVGGQGLRLTNTFDLAEGWKVQSNEVPAPAYEAASRIDHIWVGGTGISWRVPSWTVDLTRYGASSRYPSDHRPMVAEIELMEQGP